MVPMFDWVVLTDDGTLPLAGAASVVPAQGTADVLRQHSA
jgi:hypothetical protein